MAQKLPEEFQNQMKRLLGEAGFFAYLNALDEPYTRALRINLLLRPDGTPPCAIEGLGAPVPWAKGAYFSALPVKLCPLLMMIVWHLLRIGLMERLKRNRAAQQTA